MQNVIPAVNLWTARFSDYYAKEGGWQDIEKAVVAYPLEQVDMPSGQVAVLQVVLAGADGHILVSDDAGRIGSAMTDLEISVSSPIVVDGETVGFLQLPFFGITFGTVRLQGVNPFRTSLRRFLGLEVLILVAGLILGAVISRQLSHPLTRLTDATRTIANGDLTVRVPEQYPGEFGTLAVSFNAMAKTLESADELRRNMTADVAHELRTPLSVIRGKLEGVLDGVYPPTEEHLTPILEEAEILTQLVEDLRVIALAEAGQLPVENRAFDITDLLRDAEVNFTPQANDQGITLKVDAPPALSYVYADWRRVSQILGNLMTNALRHTPEGGSIVLSALQRDAFVQITVRDTGTGIAAGDIPYVFERFWRGEKSRNRQSGGSGLGLAIVKQLVELQDGIIWVESDQDAGTAITFTLPVTSG